jgi:hypothetical protein
MWNWLRRDSTPPDSAPAAVLAVPDPPAAPPRGHLKAGPYRPLHEYLRKRFADSVVLTFDQIEDLLGTTLPAEARNDQGWWERPTATATEAHCSDAWVLANRTARPNLQAQTVLFDRIG